MTLNNDNRNFIVQDLEAYKERINEKLFQNNDFFESQQNVVNEILEFIQREESCFHRTNLSGHITGSALVINSNRDKVLFTFHAKLKKWLQLGGHCDGDHLVHRVALKEANEESGLSNLEFLDILNFPNKINKLNHNHNSFELENEFILPLDIDIHLIPAREKEPAHYHYDIRYLIQANENENLSISEESIDLKWIEIDKVQNYTDEPSTLRQITKLKTLIGK